MPSHSTYSDADIVRIYCNHLDKEEKRNVVLFFLAYAALLAAKSDILELLELIPAGKVAKRFIKLILFVIDKLGSTPDVILSLLFEGAMFKAVAKCIAKELKDS